MIARFFLFAFVLTSISQPAFAGARAANPPRCSTERVARIENQTTPYPGARIKLLGMPGDSSVFIPLSWGGDSLSCSVEIFPKWGPPLIRIFSIWATPNGRYQIEWSDSIPNIEAQYLNR